MREATALTAKWASGRWVVTSASASGCRRSLTTGRAPVTTSFSAPGSRSGTGRRDESVRPPVISAEQCGGRCRWDLDSASPPGPLAYRTRRRKGGRHGPPAPVDVALARARTPRPAAVQGGGEAVPDPHRQDALAAADRARDRGRPRPAAQPGGRARGGDRADRRPPRAGREPVAAAAGRCGTGAVGRPLRQAPREPADARHRVAQPLRRQSRARRGRPGRDRRCTAGRADPVGRHLHERGPFGGQRLPRRHAGRCDVSALSTLNTANTALSAQQRALDVTAQNIANVNTDGYSRQRAELQSIGASTVPAFFSTSTGVGGGVSADTVARIRDSFAENRALAEHSSSARLTVESSAYAQIEDAFREPGATGLQTALSDMWSSWEDLSTATDVPAARRAVLESTATVVGSLQTTRTTLDAQWGQTHEDLGTLVDDVNAAAKQISTLNQMIQRATQGGTSSNELADKRDALVLSLAEKIGATASPGVDGMVDVLVGGSAVVSGTAVTRLAVSGATTADELAGSPIAVVAVPGGTKLTVGGTAGGDLNTLSTIIPQYRSALDKTAADLATALNAAHKTGTDAYGAPGGDLLVSSDGGPVTAGNLKIAIADPGRLAAATIAGTESTDGSHALAMARLGETAGVDSGYRQLITQLGVEASV